tara:strand:- start:6463 stop:6723 length:261 start_codon:yes stop_codon:yes gene_type:complete
MNQLKVFAAIAALMCSFTTLAADMPKLDKKMAEGQRAEKCADWSRAEVKGVSDKKKQASEFKEKFQQCLSKNGLPSSLAFSGKYKP